MTNMQSNSTFGVVPKRINYYVEHRLQEEYYVMDRLVKIVLESRKERKGLRVVVTIIVEYV
jgi:hypothetical protein